VSILVGPCVLEPTDVALRSPHFSADLGAEDVRIVHEKSSENRLNSLDKLKFHGKPTAYNSSAVRRRRAQRSTSGPDYISTGIIVRFPDK
jgi:hypothetical protein